MILFFIAALIFIVVSVVVPTSLVVTVPLLAILLVLAILTKTGKLAGKAVRGATLVARRSPTSPPATAVPPVPIPAAAPPPPVVAAAPAPIHSAVPTQAGASLRRAWIVGGAIILAGGLVALALVLTRTEVPERPASVGEGASLPGRRFAGPPTPEGAAQAFWDAWLFNNRLSAEQGASREAVRRMFDGVCLVRSACTPLRVIQCTPDTRRRTLCYLSERRTYTPFVVLNMRATGETYYVADVFVPSGD